MKKRKIEIALIKKRMLSFVFLGVVLVGLVGCGVVGDNGVDNSVVALPEELLVGDGEVDGIGVVGEGDGHNSNISYDIEIIDSSKLISIDNPRFDQQLCGSGDILIEKSVYIDSAQTIFRTITLQAIRRMNTEHEAIHEYDVSIIVVNEYGYITQQIHNLTASYRFLRTASWDIEVDADNPLNFHLVDYDGDGYLDMGLRASPGGSLMNDPHYIWLWDVELMQFVRNDELELVSWGGSISLRENGHIFSSFRLTSGHYVFLEYSFYNRYLTLIQYKELNANKLCNE